MLRVLHLIFLILIAAAVAAFAIANRATVELSFFPLPYSAETPIFFLILATFLLGALVTALTALFSHLHLRFQLISARKRIAALENEIGGLKAEQDVKLPVELHD